MKYTLIPPTKQKKTQKKRKENTRIHKLEKLSKTKQNNTFFGLSRYSYNVSSFQMTALDLLAAE